MANPCPVSLRDLYPSEPSGDMSYSSRERVRALGCCQRATERFEIRQLNEA
jgi:hypothetical protein